VDTKKVAFRVVLLSVLLPGACYRPEPTPADPSGDAGQDATIDAPDGAREEDGATDAGCVPCDGGCIDIRNDPDNCGVCGKSCQIGCKESKCIQVVDISADYDSTCAVLDDGRVLCWGKRLDGMIGDGVDPRGADAGQSVSAPTEAKGVTGAASVSVGDNAVIATLKSGERRCWGQILGGSGWTATPIPCLAGSDVTDIEVGTHLACGVSGGLAKCWGSNSYQKLGRPGGSASAPETVPTLASVQSVSAASDHACAATATGTYCWGSNWNGRLGIGAADNQDYPPTRVIEQGGVQATFAKVAAGSTFSCGLRAGGTVACWGTNGDDELGHPSPDESRIALTDVPGVSGVSSIHAGNRNVCVLTMGGAVICWGSASAGLLGDAGGSAPVEVMRDVKKLAASGGHACALKNDGRVLCWGSNNRGALGIGAAGGSRQVPTPPKWR
jgi:alpha-tubulin suppressor-like RCC1 family protein